MADVPIPNNTTNPADDLPWWFKYAGRSMGIAGGFVAMILGVWTCVTIYPLCIVAGIWQILAGFTLVLIEAPCCCVFIDFVQNVSNFMEKRPLWNKAAFYIILSLPGIILCPGLSTIFGSAMIFATGVIYGLMTLGRKASRTEMLSRAAQPDPMVNVLVSNMEQP